MYTKLATMLSLLNTHYIIRIKMCIKCIDNMWVCIKRAIILLETIQNRITLKHIANSSVITAFANWILFSTEWQ